MIVSDDVPIDNLHPLVSAAIMWNDDDSCNDLYRGMGGWSHGILYHHTYKMNDGSLRTCFFKGA
jgi:hypothetical protein